VIGQGGIATDPAQVESILAWPVPKTLKQTRGFLGLAGWYRRFIKKFSSISAPITNLLKFKTRFSWTIQALQAFEKRKSLLTSAPVLRNSNFAEKFYLHCDASDYGVGAVLVQLSKDGSEQTIAYMSQKLNSAQQNYSVTESECLAALLEIENFRCYLEMQDHSSLSWLMRQANPKRRDG